MDKPVLKQIDILVFPSFGGNLELRTKEGSRKFNQWIKQIEIAGKRKDIAFVIIPESLPDKTVFKKNIRDALNKNLLNRHYFLDSDYAFNSSIKNSDLIGLIKFLRSNFSFGGNVVIKRYGQHVPNACVDMHGGKLSRTLGKFLKSKGVVVNQRVATGLSVKYPEFYLLNMMEKKLGHAFEGVEARELRKLINALRDKRRFVPSKVAHAIKRSNSFGEIHQNLAALGASKTRRK
jgi:DNA primase